MHKVASPAAIGQDDSPQEHFEDTMAAGDGLCDEAAVRVLVEDGVGYVRELIDWGARFDRDRDGAAGARERRRASRPPRAPREGRDRPRDRAAAVVASDDTSAGCACSPTRAPSS